MRYVVLLRGINVGGNHKVPMQQLRSVCESLGCTDVSTYINSGNILCTSTQGTQPHDSAQCKYGEVFSALIFLRAEQ